MACENMILRLLVDKTTQKVLYAETTKEFVDFVLHFFSLPLGTVIQILGSKEMVGSLGKLKESVESLHQIYFQPGIDKDKIFNSKTAFNGNMLLLSNYVSANVKKPATLTTVYTCSNIGKSANYGNYCYSTTQHPTTSCPTCDRLMNFPLKMVAPPNKDNTVVKEADEKLINGGFVKDVVTYMVMDDLVVKPISTISSIIHINSLKVKDLSQLEEKTLHIGKDEALKLLKASLSTNEVLTTLLKQTN